MDGAEKTLPRDEFSTRMRELDGHPGAVKASSRIDITDLYGNVTTWTVDSYALGGEQGVAFVQRMSSEGGLRLVLPSEVMTAIARQRASQRHQRRRRGARQAVATRRARGDKLGNLEALSKARKAGKGRVK